LSVQLIKCVTVLAQWRLTMATIRKRNQKYQVQVRKNRYQTVSKSFSSLSVARSWAKVIEADMERQI